MSEPFTPNKPEEIVVVKITRKEAVLIDKLRKHPFGEFTIHKANGILVRIEIRDSQLIEADAPIDLT